MQLNHMASEGEIMYDDIKQYAKKVYDELHESKFRERFIVGITHSEVVVYLLGSKCESYLDEIKKIVPTDESFQIRYEFIKEVRPCTN